MDGVTLQPTAQQPAHGTNRVIAPHDLLYAATELTPLLKQCMQEFWGLMPGMRLFSISSNPHYYWHMQDFYVAQKGLDEEGKRWAQLRISEGLCQFLVETTLGQLPNAPMFSRSQIRNFEVFLLERYSRKLFQIVSPPLIKPPGRKAPPADKDQLMHLVWVLQGEPEQVTQLILTLPHACLRIPEKPQLPVWQVPDSTFLHAHAEVTAQLGTTGARLEDLQQLEPGDIIVFENSHADRWQLCDAASGAWLDVSVQVPPDRRQPDLIMAQGANPMADETQTRPNIWDNLEVEVTATFNPIKLPLKQLKEMEQGLVVEVGDLMDNRVSIEVEGHPVAWGELLVLGDRYGVRIQGMHDAVAQVTEKSPAVSTMPTGQEATPGQAQQPAAQDAPGDNFSDQSDEFMDLDLDESDFDDLDDEEDWS